MYQDEDGNLWASYEDYQNYLKIASQISSISDDEIEKVTDALDKLGKEGSDTSQSLDSLKDQLQAISKTTFDKFVNSLKEMGMTDDELKEVSNAFELV